MAKKTNTSSQKTQLPAYLQNAYKDILQAGAKTAKQPLKQYTGSTVAGFTPMQQQGFQQIGNAQGMGLPFINAASEALGDVGGLDWSGVPSDTVDWGGLGAASQAVMPGVDKYDTATMSRYMDPYMEDVINPTMQRMNQEDAKQISSLKGSGIAGFGVSPSLGDRMGLAASDLSGQQALSRNQALGGLYSQGFQNAQQQLANQQQLQLQGGTSDQNRLMQVAQLRQQGRQADADRLLASLGQQQQGGLAVAQGMAGLGQQAQDMTMQGIDYMMNAGQMQQQLGQKQLDQTKADWQQKQDYSKSQVDWLANLIYGSPGQAATTTTTEQPAPSWISQVAGLGTAAAGLFAARGGAIRRAPGGLVPQINVRDFQTDSFGWPASVPASGISEGDWYINTLPNLTPSQVGNDPRITKLPQDIRKIFGGIGRASSPGAGDNPQNTEFTKDGRPIIRRWSDGTIKTVGGKTVKRAGGGMVPGTPEYDAEVKKLLAPPPAEEATAAAAPPPPEGGLGGEHGGGRPSFFENKNLPLIYAGLGIAAGDSPYPLQNIGSGALSGLTAAQSLYEKKMGLDANPVVDDSGPTIRVWYPSEKRWEDTGIPTARWEAAVGDSREKTETERYLATKWGGDWKSNPEAIKEWTTLQSKPTTSITTNVDASGGKKFSEGLAEQGLEIVKEANAASSRAQDLELVATMAQNPDVYTGTGGEAVDAVKRFAGTVLGLQVEGVPEGEIIRQAQAQAVGRLRGLLPGPMSDGDRAFLMAATPGLTNSTEGIMLAAELARMQADSMTRKKQKLMQLMRDAEKDPEGSSTDALIGFQEWMDQPENRVFTPETLAAAQKRAASRATTAGGQHKPTAGTDAVWKKYGVPEPGALP